MKKDMSIFVIIAVCLHFGLGCGKDDGLSRWEDKIEKAIEAEKMNPDSKSWDALYQEAINENNDAAFNMIAEAAWEQMKDDPQAKVGLAFLRIETKEQYISFVKKSFEQAKEDKIKEEKDKVTIGKQTIKIGQSLKMGGIEITVKGVKVGVLEYEEFDIWAEKNKKEKTPEMLFLVATLKNVSEGQAIAPIKTAVTEGSSYVDNFNNKHKCHFSDYDFKQLKEYHYNKEIKPGESIDVFVPFDKPKVENAKEYTMDLYFAKSNDYTKEYVNSFRPERVKAVIIKFTNEEITKLP